MRDVKIIVATHKKYPMPKGSLYLPLQVGAAKNPDLTSYQKDNTGKNISAKNPNFCELTGLYWAWQNLDHAYIGLAHYRRLFDFKTKKQASDLLKTTSIILPKKRHYVIETLYSHYAHTMHAAPLDLTGAIIKERHPEYYPEFQKLKTRRSAHMFNMCVMKRELLDAYCTWLFDILFELEKDLGDQTYDPFHARFYGRISELLLDVFIRTNHLTYAEVAVKNTEPVNWPKKIKSFLEAKFLGRKYAESF